MKRGRCSGTRRGGGRPASLGLLLVDRCEDLTHLIRLRFASVVLDVDSWVTRAVPHPLLPDLRCGLWAAIASHNVTRSEMGPGRIRSYLRYSAVRRTLWTAYRSHIDHEMDRRRVSHLETFGLPNPRFYRHDVAPIFGEQRCLPPGFPYLGGDRDHTPAVADERRCRVQRGTVVFWNGDEVPRCRALPEPHLAAELQVHWVSIGATRSPPDAQQPVLGRGLRHALTVCRVGDIRGSVPGRTFTLDSEVERADPPAGWFWCGTRGPVHPAGDVASA